METIKILYLDDEVVNLTAFKATFRRYYQIFTASSAKEALQVLSQNEIHIVMIDQRMPDITGVEFLHLINEDFPHTIKILVTGYIDLGDLLDDAVKKGDVYRCINKPWTETDIRIAVEEGYKTYRFKIEKNRELQSFKNELSDSIKAPIANMEGLISLIKSEVQDEQNLQDYFEYLNQSLSTLKTRLGVMLQEKLVKNDQQE